MPHDTRTAGHQPIVKRMTLSSMTGLRLIAVASAWTGGAALLHAALAAPPSLSVPTDEDLQTDQSGAGGSFVDKLGRTSLLLGDMGGLRTELAKYGISLAIQETSEVLGNVSGGTHRGADYDGLTQMLLQLDTNRAFGWYGGTFNISALQLHGRSLSSDNLQTLQTASGIEADRSTRLWELWYQQKFLDEDRLDIKIGQQSLDQEFMVSQNAGYFINTMFGWPMVPSADLPGGGPAYPLSALGIRFRYRPIDSLTFLLGVFNGSPVANNNGDPQAVNASGTSFPLHNGVMVIGEMQFTYPALGSMISADTPQPLSRVYKLGFWYDSENFADQAYDFNGVSLASPSSNGIPLNHHGDFSVYAVADQLVWVDPHEGDRTVNVFARVLGAPQANRNLITFSANAGVTVHEPFLHRDADTFGLGFGFAKVSGFASALDQATAIDTGVYTPIRSSETYIEATYQYQATPWLQIQPDAQYVFTPGGGLADPNNPGHRIGNELVLGVRTNILF
ncbi:carbohydrate porin [Acidisphaera sp. S103]|uniref:carbohydrate porin n=1 Tax=Acidisphaera sp. S103 TaxID=1747223 RepID=UPI0020B10BDC|nr:carbohydrate porin [Acidisphaera sp. S103]